MAFAVLLKGILAGMIIAVPAGPVGILCIRRTIVEGRLAGLSSGLGAASADAIFGAIAGFGLTFLSDLLLGHQDWLRILGAIFLFYFGGRALLAEPAIALAEESGAESLAADFASAFALSITNPLTILAFLAIFAGIGFGGARATYEGAGMLVFGVWLGSLAWWLALSLGAGRMRHSFGRRHLLWLNRGSGALLVLSGIALLGSLVARHWH